MFSPSKPYDAFRPDRPPSRPRLQLFGSHQAAPSESKASEREERPLTEIDTPQGVTDRSEAETSAASSRSLRLGRKQTDRDSDSDSDSGGGQSNSSSSSPPGSGAIRPRQPRTVPATTRVPGGQATALASARAAPSDLQDREPARLQRHPFSPAKALRDARRPKLVTGELAFLKELDNAIIKRGKEMGQGKLFFADSVPVDSVLNLIANLRTARHSYELNGHLARLFVACYNTPRVGFSVLRKSFLMFLNKGNPTATHYTTMMGAYAREGRIGEALKLFLTMQNRGVRRDRVTYNLLITMLGVSARDIKGARALLRQMKSEHVSPDVITYTTLINAYGRVGNSVAALEMFDAMVADGIQPNAVSFTALIDAMARDTDRTDGAQRALDLLGKMRERHLAVSTPTYNCLLSAFGRRGDVEGMNRIVHSMNADRVRLNQESFKQLFHGHARAGAAAEVVRMWSALENTRLPVDFHHFYKFLDAFMLAQTVPAPPGQGAVSVEERNRVFEMGLRAGHLRPLKDGVLDLRGYGLEGVKLPLMYYFNKVDALLRQGGASLELLDQVLPKKGWIVILGVPKLLSLPVLTFRNLQEDDEEEMQEVDAPSNARQRQGPLDDLLDEAEAELAQAKKGERGRKKEAAGGEQDDDDLDVDMDEELQLDPDEVDGKSVGKLTRRQRNFWIRAQRNFVPSAQVRQDQEEAKVWRRTEMVRISKAAGDAQGELKSRRQAVLEFLRVFRKPFEWADIATNDGMIVLPRTPLLQALKFRRPQSFPFEFHFPPDDSLFRTEKRRRLRKSERRTDNEAEAEAEAEGEEESEVDVPVSEQLKFKAFVADLDRLRQELKEVDVAALSKSVVEEPESDFDADELDLRVTSRPGHRRQRSRASASAAASRSRSPSPKASPGPPSRERHLKQNFSADSPRSTRKQLHRRADLSDDGHLLSSRHATSSPLSH